MRTAPPATGSSKMRPQWWHLSVSRIQPNHPHRCYIWSLLEVVTYVSSTHPLTVALVMGHATGTTPQSKGRDRAARSPHLSGGLLMLGLKGKAKMEAISSQTTWRWRTGRRVGYQLHKIGWMLAVPHGKVDYAASRMAKETCVFERLCVRQATGQRDDFFSIRVGAGPPGWGEKPQRA